MNIEFIIALLIILVLAGIAFQDLRLRAIHWLWLPALAGLFLWDGLLHADLNIVLQNFGYNMAFLVLQFAVLTLWFSLKEGRFSNIVDRYLGLGDVLFFVAIALAFSVHNFIIVFTCALLFSLVSYLIYILVKPNANKHIPLAGLMAFPLMGIEFATALFEMPKLHTESILSWAL